MLDFDEFVQQCSTKEFSKVLTRTIDNSIRNAIDAGFVREPVEMSTVYLARCVATAVAMDMILLYNRQTNLQ